MANLPLGFALLLTGGVSLATAVLDPNGNPLPVLAGKDTGPAGFAGASSTSSASSSTTTVAGSAAGVNPFAAAQGFKAERTDMGVDAAMSPGSPIVAPWPSKFLGTVSNWYDGQPYMAFEVTAGQYAGKVYYLAEQIDPIDFTVGEVVDAGQQIASYASSGTGIEMGWANPSNWRQTLAQGTTGYIEGEVTAAGAAFRQAIKALGAAV